ncbi:patatin-like phospholipase family protein [Chitinophaga nivalis]|uniref:Patatin-like phospholipase family protein n=1 Tax=Chitinophaga nivalis TaxID=2991709 RepID=A0ABT3IVH3_9BACT|nr:patatin-like phospholipase family protein [Chitinophaga nivalis]MCW3462326.1 patatin-like phospholipase family protein [Chitinophaga nivalis]MCW3487983.1 patatin-like phospholipase family protein [Chitinophaga nivalis]
MKVKLLLVKIYYSFPIQLLLLHFRKYQVLLIFWVILFSTINGGFAKVFGGDALYLAPEYLGKVNFYSTTILGLATGMFIMSWQITTFILHTGRFKFLATTSQPFFKYCLNNSIIPLLFAISILYHGWEYQRYQQLNSIPEIMLLGEGYICGLLFIIFFCFFYFFNADKNIGRRLEKRFGNPRNFLRMIMKPTQEPDENALPVHNYLSTPWRIRRARNVDHYNKHYLDSILKQHHFAAMITVGCALIFLVILAYMMDYDVFRIPAGASVLIFFAFLIGVAGAYSYMLQTWSIPVLLVLLFGLNWMVEHNWVDNRNKAYGLNYRQKKERREYSVGALQQFFTKEKYEEDVQHTLQILDTWRAKFPAGKKPPLVVMNFSGGGSRSATWTVNVLQRLDRLLKGSLMQHTVLMTGASGGMMGASYFRELYYRQQIGKSIFLGDSIYAERISRDLLNSVFSAMAVNDFITPWRSFSMGKNRYAKDRGYAFEMQLNEHTDSVLNKPIKDYREPEQQAIIPMLIWNATINADGRRLMISPQPISYLCSPQYLYPTRQIRDIDGVDFGSYFARQDAMDLRVTSAIRMCATFPYVLPNTFLPSNPIVDVMDAGIRDNFGQQTTLRYLYTFRQWINENTSGVIYIQIRDTRKNDISPIKKTKDLSDLLFEPLFTMQQHWSAMQDFDQDDLLNYMEGYFPDKFHRIIFQYVPQQENKAAALSWHLTSREKLDIAHALDNPANQSALDYVVKLLSEQ